MCKVSIPFLRQSDPKRWLEMSAMGLPGGVVDGSPPVNAGDTGLIPGPEGSTCHGATKLVHTTTEPVL